MYRLKLCYCILYSVRTVYKNCICSVHPVQCTVTDENPEARV